MPFFLHNSRIMIFIIRIYQSFTLHSFILLRYAKISNFSRVHVQQIISQSIYCLKGYSTIIQRCSILIYRKPIFVSFTNVVNNNQFDDSITMYFLLTLIFTFQLMMLLITVKNQSSSNLKIFLQYTIVVRIFATQLNPLI